MSQALQISHIDGDTLVKWWLIEKHGRSQSDHTARGYREMMAAFRSYLAETMPGHDLDAPAHVIRLAVTKWAALRYGHAAIDPDDPEHKRRLPAQIVAGEASNATYNRRLSMLSSFYTWAIRKEFLADNPIKGMEHRSTATSRHAEVLTQEAIQGRLAAIDRSTTEGLRDYALLAVGLSTGRRAAELAGLRMGDVKHQGAKVTLHFTRTKGGKAMDDQLARGVGQALLKYIRVATGKAPEDLPADAPVWRAASAHNRGGAISTQAISDLCQKHLGVSTVHTLRHSFAAAMDAAGAPVTTIQKRLGHSSIAVTAKYLHSLPDPVNPFADTLADGFGIE